MLYGATVQHMRPTDEKCQYFCFEVRVHCSTRFFKEEFARGIASIIDSSVKLFYRTMQWMDRMLIIIRNVNNFEFFFH